MGFSLFPALFDRPSNIRFIDQEENEVIELFLRQHWITNLSWVFTTIIGVIAPLIIVNQDFYQNFIRQWQVPVSVLLSVDILWYLFILAVAINGFVYWYFNIYIVTDRHLADISLQNLMHRNVVEIQLNDIQSVSSNIQGIGRSFLNYGDVTIRTAGHGPEIHFVSVPHPDLVRERIQDLQDLQDHGHHPGGNNAN